MSPLLPEQKEWEKYHALAITNEQMTYEYFRLIDKQDIEGLLRLFAEDATVYEPFSKEQKTGLRGKAAIEYFLRIAIMANKGTKHSIEFANDYYNHCGSGKLEREKASNEITALITFEHGDMVKVKFHFKFIIIIELLEDQRGLTISLPSKKVKELEICFVQDF